MTYALAAMLAFVVSWAATSIVRRFSLRAGIVDAVQTAPERKIHQGSVPLLGGVAPFMAFTFVSWGYALLTPHLFGGFLLPKHLAGITLAGVILMVGGYLDDRYHLRPSRQIWFPVAASFIAIASGIGIPYITNPFGGTIDLHAVAWTVLTIGGLPYRILPFADSFAFGWLLATTYTTKILDGLDGLVAGITVIGGSIIGFLSLTKEVTQPETALLAFILAGAAGGFLIWNWHPAKIFLGEGGSTWTGFMLGVLAILAGGKIATALLILGLPALDIAWSIGRRIFPKRSALQADRKHLHFRLLDAGLSQRRAVLVLYAITAAFGSITLFGHGLQKVFALAALLSVMVILAAGAMWRYRKRSGTAM